MTYVRNGQPPSDQPVAAQQPVSAPHQASHVPRWIRWMFAGIIFGACISAGIIFGGWTYLGSWLTQHGI